MELSRKALSIGASPTLSLDAKAKKMKLEGIDVIGFGVGEPDFDTPIHIKEAAKKAIDEGFTKYTAAAGIPELKDAICRKFKNDNQLEYAPSQIVVSNGAKHSLMNAFMAILNPLDEVIIPSPYWVSYPEMVKLADGVPVFVEASESAGFRVKASDIDALITPKTKALVINSPSNPTGMIYSKQELQDIAELAIKRDIFIISDEIYEELIYGENKHISIASFSEEIKNRTIIVNGVSKSYAMTGWRIGYTASSVDIANLMANIQSQATSNPNSIAQKATLEALNGSKNCILEMKKEFKARRDYLVERVNKVDGLSCIEPEGAFYVMMNISKLFGKTCDGKKITNSNDFSQLLLEKANVAAVAGSAFGVDEFLRLSYATSLHTIKKGLDRIEEFVSKLV